jgi:glycosyltransferase involved in cell wall biosynthesis
MFADYSIVTNNELAEIIRHFIGRAIILPDKLPVLIEPKKNDMGKGKHVLCVCTFADDEPYEEMITAASYLTPDIYMYFTGNYSKIKDYNHLLRKYSNIRFTGYLNETDYNSILFSSDIIVDLTNRENCLVCGAYEAIALNKLVILSDTEALRKYFGECAVYTKNDAISISRCIINTLVELDSLTQKALKNRSSLELVFSEYFSIAEDIIKK